MARINRPRRPTSNPRAKRQNVKRIRATEAMTGMAYDTATFRLMKDSADARAWYETNQPRTFEAFLRWLARQP